MRELKKNRLVTSFTFHRCSPTISFLMEVTIIFWNRRQIITYPSLRILPWHPTGFRYNLNLSLTMAFKVLHDPASAYLSNLLLSQLICGLAHCPSIWHVSKLSLCFSQSLCTCWSCRPPSFLKWECSHLVALLHFSLFDDLQRISHFLKLSHLFVCLMSVFPSMLASWESTLISLTHHWMPSTWQNIWLLTGAPSS